MKFKDLQNNDRPREKLINKGADSLSDAELLAIILRTGINDKDVLDLANDILRLYPIERLKELLYEELIKIPGIKSAKACSILAVFELAKRSYVKKDKLISFEKSKEIYDFVYSEIVNETRELLIIIFVDTKLRMLKKEKYINYNPNSVIFPVKRIMQIALNIAATGIIIIHNHPSGDVKPSKSDLAVTKEIIDSFNRVEIEVLDHLIVSDNSYYSFSENGILDEDDEYNFLGDYI